MPTSLVLRSYPMHDYVTNTFLLLSSSVWSKELSCFELCFVIAQGQKLKRAKTYRKKSLLSFIIILLYYCLYNVNSFCSGRAKFERVIP